VKKTHQNKKIESRSDSIGTEKALEPPLGEISGHAPSGAIAGFPNSPPACSRIASVLGGTGAASSASRKWRRDAITRHDLHHILTGYSCTMTREMQMAAWEFAAGRYRHWAATLFCLPLR
jgi:hypothetical protein